MICGDHFTRPGQKSCLKLMDSRYSSLPNSKYCSMLFFMKNIWTVVELFWQNPAWWSGIKCLVITLMRSRSIFVRILVGWQVSDMGLSYYNCFWILSCARRLLQMLTWTKDNILFPIQLLLFDVTGQWMTWFYSVHFCHLFWVIY